MNRGWLMIRIGSLVGEKEEEQKGGAEANRTLEDEDSGVAEGVVEETSPHGTEHIGELEAYAVCSEVGGVVWEVGRDHHHEHRVEGSTHEPFGKATQHAEGYEEDVIGDELTEAEAKNEEGLGEEQEEGGAEAAALGEEEGAEERGEEEASTVEAEVRGSYQKMSPE